MDRLKELQIEFNKLLDSQHFIESELDYGIVDRHIELLKQFDAVNTGSISVFDLFRREHVYYSPKYQTILGWDLEKIQEEDIEYSNSRIHPDDLIIMMEAGNYFTSLGLKVPPEDRYNYKMYVDYRIMGADDKYVRIIEQHTMMESDKRGNLWLSLSTLDLSPYKETETPVLCRMLDIKTGQLYQFPPPDPEIKKLLTMREKEILDLISKGLISREIADILYISVNTVNTHRQRIIEKLDVSSTSEAIRYAIDLGILSAVNS